MVMIRPERNAMTPDKKPSTASISTAIPFEKKVFEEVIFLLKYH
jgi:hypothetical protein